MTLKNELYHYSFHRNFPKVSLYLKLLNASSGFVSFSLSRSLLTVLLFIAERTWSTCLVMERTILKELLLKFG